MWKGVRGWAQVSAPALRLPSLPGTFLCGLTVSTSPSPAPGPWAPPSQASGSDSCWVVGTSCQRALPIFCLFSTISGSETLWRSAVCGRRCSHGRRGAGGLHVNSRRRKRTQRLAAGTPGSRSHERPLLF